MHQTSTLELNYCSETVLSESNAILPRFDDSKGSLSQASLKVNIECKFGSNSCENNNTCIKFCITYCSTVYKVMQGNRFKPLRPTSRNKCWRGRGECLHTIIHAHTYAYLAFKDSILPLSSGFL